MYIIYFSILLALVVFLSDIILNMINKFNNNPIFDISYIYIWLINLVIINIVLIIIIIVYINNYNKVGKKGLKGKVGKRGLNGDNVCV